MQASPVNRTERHSEIDWNVIDWRKVNKNVRNLRQRIFRATQEGDWDKVQSLERLMLRSTSNIAESVRRVTQVNQGKNTPGIDKVTVKTPEKRSELLNYIIDHTTPWRATPVRRVYIPKANGKQRPLGIPIMLDRALQAIVKNALEPSWEARFEATSYGFRPGRSAQDAIVQIWTIANRQAKVWILDADIDGCFDNINHEHLLETIGVFPARELIKQWLKAGYVEYGTMHETPTGTPQGGVISPLLANISLHGIEAPLGITYRKKVSTDYIPMTREGKCAVIRYADDFVVMCETEELAKEAQERLTEWLAIRGLQLSTEKTKIVHLKDGFDFLGFNVRTYRSSKKQNGWKILVKPSKKSVSKVRRKLREEWKSLKGHRVGVVIGRLNPIIRGWANYFRTQVSSKTFQGLDKFMYEREYAYLEHLHPTKSWYWRQQQYYGKLNLEREDKWVFGDKAHQRHINKFSWTGIVRHTMVTGTYSPDDPNLQEYWLKRERAKIHTLRPRPKKLAKLQDGKCPICGESLFIEENIETHHIVPKVPSGNNTDDNLLLIHYYCHQQLTYFQRKMGYL